MRALTAGELRELRRAAQSLKARITVGRAGLSDALVAQVRQALAQTPLLKVRVGAQDRDAIDAIGRRLSAEVPCVLVSRIGFVLTLYRPADSDSS